MVYSPKTFIRPLIIVSAIFFFAHHVSADSLNQQMRFVVDPDFDVSSRTSVDATLKYIGNNVYVYVDDTYFNGLDLSGQTILLGSIKVISTKFDNDIYPKERAFFGSEPNPGIDNDPKITILVQKTNENTGGYINTDHFYEKGVRLESNKREMVFLNARVVKESPDFAAAFLAHEFQHMISFQQKEKNHGFSEEVWLNELRSEYAVTVSGLNDFYQGSTLNRRVTSFLNDPSDSLVEWPNKAIDYGIASLFGEYLVEQYGPGILKETMKSNLRGIDSIDNFLSRFGTSFSKAFIDWMTAVHLNDPLIGLKMSYKRAELTSIRVTDNSSNYFSGDFSLVESLKPWQPAWHSYTLGSPYGKSIKISLQASSDYTFLGRIIGYLGDGTIVISEISSAKPIGHLVNNGSGINKFSVMLTNSSKRSAFENPESLASVLVRLEGVDQAPLDQELKNGVLIKKQGQNELYVIEGKYKRYLSPQVVSLYGHLDPLSAISVAPDIFDSYKTSNYVKNVNDKKVYAVWADNTRHWLNMTGEYFTDSGRDWGAIFVINDLELNYYVTGADIIH